MRTQLAKKRVLTASRDDALAGIYAAARDSVVGRLIYRKWIPSERRFVKEKRDVVPLKFGLTSRNNLVIYCADYGAHKQTKAFLVSGLESFTPGKMRVSPPYKIEFDNIKRVVSRFVKV